MGRYELTWYAAVMEVISLNTYGTIIIIHHKLNQANTALDLPSELSMAANDNKLHFPK